MLIRKVDTSGIITTFAASNGTRKLFRRWRPRRASQHCKSIWRHLRQFGKSLHRRLREQPHSKSRNQWHHHHFCWHRRKRDFPETAAQPQRPAFSGPAAVRFDSAGNLYTWKEKPATVASGKWMRTASLRPLPVMARWDIPVMADPPHWPALILRQVWHSTNQEISISPTRATTAFGLSSRFQIRTPHLR